MKGWIATHERAEAVGAVGMGCDSFACWQGTRGQCVSPVLTGDLSDEHRLLQGSRDAGAAGADSLHPHLELLTGAEVLDRVPGGKKGLLVHLCPVCA